MDGQGEAVRPPVSGPDSRGQQSGSRGRVRHGNGASDKQREDQDTSSHTYENDEEVKRFATSAGVRPERQPECYGLSDEAARIHNPMYASNPGTTTPMLQPQSLRSEADVAAKIDNPMYPSNACTTTPMQQQQSLRSRAEVAAKIDNPMYPSNACTTPKLQPQSLRSRADAAAKIPNPMLSSNAGTRQPPSHWRSLANAAAKMFNPMYAFSSADPPMDQPQTEYQVRANDAENTPEVTYATIPDDPPMDQPQTDHQGRANDAENTPDVSHASIPDRAYPGGASGRRGVCSFLYARRSCVAAGIAVLLGLVAVGLAPLTFSNKQEISHLSTTVKLDQDDIRQLYANVDALKRDQDALKRDQDNISATVDAWKRNRNVLERDQDNMSQLPATVDALKCDQDNMSTTVDALKRDQDDFRRLSTTVDALKREQDDMSATVDALKSDQDTLKREQDDMSATVDTLKRIQDDMSTTVDALKSGQDGMSNTVDALKRDQDGMSATVDALKRGQDDMSNTVDALKREQDNLRQLCTTADAAKRDNKRSQTATSEKRLHEKTLASCLEGYTKWRGICYKVFNTRKTFIEAAGACREEGGTLAMPRDADTNAFLISLYKSVSVHLGYWIGLHDQRIEGRFEWVDGSALGPYSSWAPGEPNNGDQDCVAYLDVHRRQARVSPLLYSGSLSTSSQTNQ
ncbi:hypothetical protein Bbelb_306860 [Branchiostoma belcheri]|nr:hypothetical protein Bbelb_306860 [Branchiostoma belcheri]